ncbi:hypothetical protein BJY04DRAFT_216470 [Aspergillus karnatakaensis]|uniref:uncharacterized protein n=1 Tax=Aspergillus karnatakaensis TaxID=1810916 RepID=UPI003CCD1A9D
MKRKGAPGSSEHTRRAPRQDPVSCESCRKKKLKCDRQRPCSSCVTRRLACTFQTDPPFTTKTTAHRDSGQLPISPASTIHQQDPPDVSIPRSGGHAFHDYREMLVTADWLEHIHMGDRVSAALSPQLRAELDGKPKEYTQSQGEAPSRILLSILRGSWAPTENPATVDLIRFLPSESDTANLFNYYCRYISYLYHIIIPHVVERQINEVYRSVERGAPMNYSYLALLFAITGSSLMLQCSIESSTHATRCSQQFSFLTGAALAQGKYSTYPSVEGLQAVLIIFHFTSNINLAMPVSGFFELGSIVSQARNMKLHLLDSPGAIKERELHGANSAELEVKRRLWWDITSFDWCLAFLSGPQEWTYLINPTFVHTKRPSNIDDAMVESATAQPRTTPTSMSFFLERLNLTEVCRAFVDAMSEDQLSGKEVEYSKVLELDRMLHQAQAEAPDFFRLDSNSRRQYTDLYQERPTLAWQRCLLQQGYYSRLCRLHRPYFIRGARNPQYSYSYIAGLDAARKVLEIQRIMDEEEPRLTPSSSVVWSIMHHVFMAAVMLLLDVCYIADDLLAEKRKEEVLEACRMLRKAQQSSALVREGINAMMGVMQGHCMSGKLVATTAALGVPGEASKVPTAGSATECMTGPPALEGLHQPDSLTENLALVQTDRDLEHLWSEFIDNGSNMGLEADDWTVLFSELAQTTLPPS